MSAALHILVFVVSVLVVGGTVLSAVRTFILPRSAPDRLARIVFLALRKLFELRIHWANTYEERDAVMAYYAPFALLALLVVWLGGVLLGYTGLFWSIGVDSWYDAFRISASSLTTLGTLGAEGLVDAVLILTEAAFGLILVALLIGYLPTMYSAFSRREAAVSLLEVRAGQPPSALEMLWRFHRIHGLGNLTEQWRIWEMWFADVEESHTSLAALVFFRSPQPNHSWVTAAGAVLDTASLTASCIDQPRDAQAELCIRAGYLCLRHIADFFQFRYNPNPHYPDDPISISRLEFDQTYDKLVEYGLPLKPDREQAWRDFAGWRVNYDAVLLALCALTMAPYAPWSSDRSLMRRRAVPDAPVRAPAREA